jgi:hypothetical protein
MNKMPADEWEGFKTDILAGFVGAIILLIGIWFWLRSDPGPLLVNEMCAPSKPVIVDGEKVGCTNDEATSQPDYYPVNE